MAGGLMQLIAYGEEDVYLTGNPQVTYFKIVYKRHTNFAMESVKQEIEYIKSNWETLGKKIDFGERVRSNIARKGDLIKNIWLEATLPELEENYGWVDNIGHALINEASIEIGGQRIEKMYGSSMNILSDLTIPQEKKVGFNEMIGNIPLLKPRNGKKCPSHNIYVHFPFWFSKHHGLAFPMISSKYHNINTILNINSLENLILQQKSINSEYSKLETLPSVHLIEPSLWVDYIYLEDEERRKFVQRNVMHTYLIEQLQFSGDKPIVDTTFTSIRLNFNHPVKELIWVVLKEDSVKHNQWFNWTDNRNIEAKKVNSINGYAINNNPVKTAGITFGNRDKYSDHNRFQQRDGTYFNKVQPFQYHTNIPSSSGINIYSFALEPEKQYPSGQFNASRIDTLKLKLTFDVPTTGIVKIFAVYTQPLLISSGMAGLKWSG